MHVHVPMTPPRRPATAGVITVRVIICVLIVLTLGMLAWIAMLRIAIMRRRGQDWALFWCQLVLNVACLVPLEQSFADHWIANVGMAGLLLQMVGVVTYYLIVDIHHHQRGYAAPVFTAPPAPHGPPPMPVPGYGYPPQPAPQVQPQPPSQPQLHTQPQPPAQPQPQPQPVHPPHRIDQVRAELDELSAYLRNDNNDNNNGERGR
ncbi:hypothetical protein OHA27_13685 [Streptomyces sp. NBC_01619]|uniref:hypothetical protein n=1 Tax=unclassified Streptomyces TaxID=2593676 RepID=UPI0022503BFF|nr:MULTISPECIES: hypothetical protein [unclassified Streptomyces]MCX4511339.1 hypothetical protein [Streptomyces sp. NBC_01619]